MPSTETHTHMGTKLTQTKNQIRKLELNRNDILKDLNKPKLICAIIWLWIYKVHPNVNKNLFFPFTYLFSELQFKFLARRPSYRRDSQHFFFSYPYNSKQTVGKKSILNLILTTGTWWVPHFITLSIVTRNEVFF